MEKITRCRSTHAGSSTCPGCRPDFDFEKQRYRTKEEMTERNQVALNALGKSDLPKPFAVDGIGEHRAGCKALKNGGVICDCGVGGRYA